MGFEVTGLVSGIDSGSATSCAATSCNYTTATANEFTVFVAGDSPTSVAMAPGNSFLEIGYDQRTSGSTDMGAGLVAAKNTTSSGSNTASFSVTGSSAPMMSVLAFAETPTSVPRKSGGWIGK
jgi:hypothetical protein